MNIKIETERLVLREFTEKDLPSLAVIGNQRHIVFWVPDWEGCERWINDWFIGVRNGYKTNDPRKRYILLAVTLKETGEIIGQINIGREFDDYFPGELSIGYFISEKFMYAGYATEAVKAFAGYAFDQYGVPFIMAVVKPKNGASIRVLEKSGFRRLSNAGQDERMPFHYYRLYHPKREAS